MGTSNRRLAKASALLRKQLQEFENNLQDSQSDCSSGDNDDNKELMRLRAYNQALKEQNKRLKLELKGYIQTVKILKKQRLKDKATVTKWISWASELGYVWDSPKSANTQETPPTQLQSSPPYKCSSDESVSASSCSALRTHDLQSVPKVTMAVKFQESVDMNPDWVAAGDFDSCSFSNNFEAALISAQSPPNRSTPLNAPHTSLKTSEHTEPEFNASRPSAQVAKSKIDIYKEAGQGTKISLTEIEALVWLPEDFILNSQYVPRVEDAVKFGSCKGCQPFFDIYSGDGHCRHHEKQELRPSTPPNFWRSGFPDTDEAQQDKLEAQQYRENLGRNRLRQALSSAKFVFRNEWLRLAVSERRVL